MPKEYTQEFLDILNRYKILKNRKPPIKNIENVLQVISEHNDRKIKKHEPLLDSLKIRRSVIKSNSDDLFEFLNRSPNKNRKSTVKKSVKEMTVDLPILLPKIAANIDSRLTLDFSTLASNAEKAYSYRAQNLKSLQLKAKCLVQQINSHASFMSDIQTSYLREKASFGKVSERIRKQMWTKMVSDVEN